MTGTSRWEKNGKTKEQSAEGMMNALRGNELTVGVGQGEEKSTEKDEETININSVRRNLCFPRERSNC